MAADRAARELVARERARGTVFKSEAERLSALARWHPERGVREKSQAKLRALEQREAAKAHDIAVAEGLADSVRLAQLRGEDVEVGKTGPLQIRSRDILAFMHRREFLTTPQFRAGRQYQRLAEMSDPARALTPAALDGVRMGGGSNEAFAQKLLPPAPAARAWCDLGARGHAVGD